MKKFLAIAMAFMLVTMLAACGGAASSAPPAGDGAAASEPASTSAPAEGGSSAAPEVTGEGYELAMITDKGNIDDKSFNQGTWEGVQEFAAANGKTCQYYKPTEVSDDAYLAAIDLAIQGGAKVVVTPGFLFANAIGAAMEKYPDVNFMLIDSTPSVNDEPVDPAANCVSIIYAEEQAGYLAGYAAVKDGNTKLGFMGGMAVPAVVRYGFGYAQGANDAAAEMDVQVEMKYFYTGGFEATPEWQAMAASWYQSGAEVIFGCGGTVGNSVFAAAEASGGKAIGVDVDQSAESDTIITSAMKGLKESVNLTLTAYYEGNFPGGQVQTLGAAEDSVGLPMATSKFDTFTQEDYDHAYSEIAAGRVSIPVTTDSSDENPNNITTGFTNLTIDYISQ